MQLPKSEQLNIAGLSRLFDNKAECYKLFWFQAILNHVCRGRQEIRFEELIDDMIANAWYMVTEYHLNLGPGSGSWRRLKNIGSCFRSWRRFMKSTGRTGWRRRTFPSITLCPGPMWPMMSFGICIPRPGLSTAARAIICRSGSCIFRALPVWNICRIR